MSAADAIKGYCPPPVRARLTWLINEYDVKSVIEVGSFVGQSAVFFSELVESVTCIDPFDLDVNPYGTMTQKLWVYEEAGYKTHYETFLANTLPFPNIRSIKLPSLEAAVLPLEADLVYVDGSHSYRDVIADIAAWRPHARKVLCGDDNLNERFGVTEAVKKYEIPNREERVWWEIRGS